MPETTAAREIRITRVYDAPRELVWKAWTEPERLATWWGKRGWNTPVDSVTTDLRPGGAFRLMSICEADGREMALEAVYRYIEEPERLVFEEAGSIATVTFTDLGDGRTEMTLDTSMVAGDELLELARGGLSSAFDRLGEHLAATPTDHQPPRSTP